MQYVLGIDGGNSKTVALIARLDGTIVGAGRGGCGDIYKNVDGALEAVEHAVAQARTDARLNARRVISTGVFSMAGADWPEDFALLAESFKARRYAREIIVTNDAIGAVRAGCKNGFGVAIAAGTGAATGARSHDGKIEWHSSFWQVGAAAIMLGVEAIRHVYRSELGMQPPTALRDRILQHFGLNTVESLLHGFTAREIKRPGPPDRLARIVLDTAHDGDQIAVQIVREEAQRLAETAIAAARIAKLGDKPFPLVMIGSVFRHDCRLLGKTIVKHVRREFPEVEPVYSDVEPCAGAVIMALEKAGVTVDEKIRANIVATMPPRSFFAT